MPESKKADYLASAKSNLNQANNTYSPEQYVGFIAAAQAQATIAVAEQTARLADAAELANLLQARALGAFDTAEEYKATRDKIRELAGLSVSTVA